MLQSVRWRVAGQGRGCWAHAGRGHAGSSGDSLPAGTSPVAELHCQEREVKQLLLSGLGGSGWIALPDKSRQLLHCPWKVMPAAQSGLCGAHSDQCPNTGTMLNQAWPPGSEKYLLDSACSSSASASALGDNLKCASSSSELSRILRRGISHAKP